MTWLEHMRPVAANPSVPSLELTNPLKPLIVRVLCLSATVYVNSANRSTGARATSKNALVSFVAYTSRLENGHTVPSIETLEKFAAVFDVPLWKIFYEGDQPTRPLLSSRDLGQSEIESPKDRKLYLKLARLLGRMTEKDRHLLYYALQKMARRRRTPTVKKKR